MRDAFHRRHEAIYDFADPAAPIQLVNLRLVIAGATDRPAMPAEPFAGGAPAAEREVTVWHDGARHVTPLYLRDALQHGQEFAGPAIVAQEDATTCIPAGFRARVDAFGNLHLHADA